MDTDHEEKQTKPSAHNYTKWIAIVGAIMIFFPDRLPTVWGNMTVYVTSYFYHCHGNTSVASTWPLAAYTIGGALGTLAAGYITRVGRKKLVFFAILVFNLAIFSMYYTLKHGFTFMIFFAFGVVGVCSGVISPVVFKSITEMAGPSKGKFMSIACSGFNFGPAFINSFVGFFMNPQNFAPTLILDDRPLFDEREIIERVPSLIITLGISYFLCMLTGFCLLFFTTSSSSTKSTREVSGSSSKLGNYHLITTLPPEDLGKSSEIELNDLNTECFNSESTTTINLTSSEDTSDDDKDDDVDSSDSEINITHRKEYDTRDLLKNIPFYVLSFSFGIGVFPTILLFGSYKTFGLLFTKDDHLLTALGTLHPLVGGLIRIVWGFILDRLRTKLCLILIYTCLSLTVMLMYFAPIVNMDLYFIATLLVAAAVNTLVPTFLLAIVAYFGEKHFCKTFALLKCSRFMFALIISPLFEELRESFGWCGPFFCVAMLTTISLILIVSFVHEVPKVKK